MAQGTGWVLLRKVAEATVLVPLGSPCPVQHFVPEQHPLACWGGAVQRPRSPKEPARRAAACPAILLASLAAAAHGFYGWIWDTLCKPPVQAPLCEIPGKWHKAFTIVSVLADE